MSSFMKSLQGPSKSLSHHFDLVASDYLDDFIHKIWRLLQKKSLAARQSYSIAGWLNAHMRRFLSAWDALERQDHEAALIDAFVT